MEAAFKAVMLRELRAYFLSPLAYVFLSVYLLVSGLATWNLARFFDTAIASLSPFFQFQPWLLAIFIPAIGMRLWSEDLRLRTADLYFSSHRPLWLIHAAKLSAGLVILALALVSTFPYWLAVNYLGPADNGVIVLSYLSLFGVGLIFQAITLVFSALTQQQVIAFVLSTLVAFAFLTLGLPAVTGRVSDVLPSALASWLQGFSLLDGYVQALRGQFSFADFAFGLLLAASLFALGVQRLARHRRKGEQAGLAYGSLAFALIFMALPVARTNLAHLTSSWRLDVTGYRLNTLSPAAARLAASLDEPITLTFFYNDAVGRDYPEIRTHAERVRALLDAYTRASGGRLKLVEVNPTPFSAGEDLAISLGIDAIPTEGLDPLYFGLSARNLVDDQLTISFLNPELDRSLEFDIASLLARLDRPSQPKLAILSGIPALSEAGYGGPASRLMTTLQAGFDIDWLNGEALAIDDDVDALLVIAPEKLTDYTAYQIDQFLLRKGRVIVLTDPLALLSEAQTPPENLLKLLENWGVQPSQDILADTDLGLPVNTGRYEERQPLYPGPGPANRASGDFLVSGLKRQIYFGASGWFAVIPDTKQNSQSLIFSGPSPACLPHEVVEGADLSPAGVRALAKPTDAGNLPIALRLSGQFTTLFTDGAPEPALPDDPVLLRLAQSSLIERPHLKRSQTPGEIVLIADTDFLMDGFYVHPQTGEALADNEALILSILDQFAGRPELAALRTRPEARRPMTRIMALRAAAETEYIEAQDKAEAAIAEIEARIKGPLSDADPALRAEYLAARESLRDLQRAFRSRILGLETWLRVLTIWLPVALFILAGLGIQLIRGRTR